MWLLTVSYQKGGILGLNVLGAGLLTWSGFNFSAGEPQVRTGVAGVVLSVLAVLFFYLLAIPTMGRARFSTRTIGREGLVGKTGAGDHRLQPGGGGRGRRCPMAGNCPSRIGDHEPEPKSWSWRFRDGGSRSSQVAKIDLRPSIISLADPGRPSLASAPPEVGREHL